MTVSWRPEELPQFRITVNSRCERACFFCRPSGEAVATAPGVELRVADLVQVAAAAFDVGFRSAKLTGGDPALYAPLEKAVAAMRHMGYEEIEVISRHPRLANRAQDLANAGVTLFNVSLDTLDAGLHHEICSVDDHSGVLSSISACVATGVPVKVNTVVMAGINDHELSVLAQFCENSGVETLKLLDVIHDLDDGGESYARRLAAKRGGARLADLYVPLTSLAEPLARTAVSRGTVHQGGLGHPMMVLKQASGLDVVLKDSAAGAWYGSICDGCVHYPCHDALMALRLTADMRLQFCLLRDDIAIDLRPLLPAGSKVMASAIADAVSVYATASFRSTGIPVELSRR